MIFLFLLPATKNESSVMKCHIALIIWYSRGRQAGACGIYQKEHAGESF
jgi:hypothetical protein